MKFILQMITDASTFASMAPDESQALEEAVNAFNDRLRDAGAWVSAEGLHAPDAARTVRFEDGHESLISDGPFSAQREQLSGFWIVETDSAEEAVEWARKAPLENGAIEVRPLFE